MVVHSAFSRLLLLQAASHIIDADKLACAAYLSLLSSRIYLTYNNPAVLVSTGANANAVHEDGRCHVPLCIGVVVVVKAGGSSRTRRHLRAARVCRAVDAGGGLRWHSTVHLHLLMCTPGRPVVVVPVLLAAQQVR